MTTLAERLEKARRQQFVGRVQELTLFRDAINADELPFVLLYFYGPGGVGKTSLLREFAHIAQESAIDYVKLDGRNLEAVPDYFLTALQQQLDVPDTDTLFAKLRANNGRFLILIDTAELLTPLDNWFQDVFLPQMPDNILVVFAGRNPPSLRWRSDPGWQSVMAVRSLQNLNREESRAFLMRRRIPAGNHETILNFTHGHPLALSLGADVITQQPETPFHPQDAPNIIKTLLDQFVQDAPSPTHRAALEACSQVRLLNEPLLGEMLNSDDPHPLFNWLRGLSFIDADRRGLYPHDLAREALAADLRWRNPDWLATLHDRARNFYMTRFQEGSPKEQRTVLSDYIYLHRENPVIRPYFEWQAGGTVFTDKLRDGDKQAIVRMINKHEGKLAAGIAAHWLSHKASQFTVLRGAAGIPNGVLGAVALEKTTVTDHELDPGVRAIWHFLKNTAPLRQGETATCFRFWMADETYQGVSPVQSRIFINMVQHYLTTAGLAYTFIPCADADFWTDVFAFADLHRLPEADFTVGDHHFGVYGHDWRVLPPLAWLGLMAVRELGTAPAVTQVQLEPLRVLSKSEFATAVHDALRDFRNTVSLQKNPLLNSRLVAETVGSDVDTAEKVSGLQKLIFDTAVLLQQTPRQAKWHRVLHHTFFQPAPTQEKAAELLDLPFSTYRRHLRSGINAITERLWEMELGQR